MLAEARSCERKAGGQEEFAKFWDQVDMRFKPAAPLILTMILEPLLQSALRQGLRGIGSFLSSTRQVGRGGSVTYRHRSICV